MRITMKAGVSEGEVRALIARLEARGLQAYREPSASPPVLAAIAATAAPDRDELARLDGVAEVVPLARPYKLASREFRSEDTVVWVKGVPIGGRQSAVIAGPCTVEGAAQLIRIARQCRDRGAAILRGGAYKPRTSPYTFQGLGRAGLKLLRACGDRLGMPVCTEVVDTREVELVERHADLIQVGARNMQNYRLLREVGRTRTPVLLKRGPSATIQELLLAAEYILAEGNRQVILCERGIKTFEPASRYTLDVACIPVVRRESHLPIIVDPSHAAGRRDLVPALAWAGLAAGAHGLIVEVHDDPDAALCDGPHALRPSEFSRLMTVAAALAEAAGRPLGPLPGPGAVLPDAPVPASRAAAPPANGIACAL